jgi:AraC-like DNA-binding protein
VGISDARIVTTLQRLDSFPLSGRLRESAIAAEVGLGVSQFVRIFREEMGETPKQYFDQRRRAYCRQMLGATSVPIKEIAYNLGFSRLSDFSAWFKHQFDMPPRTFRKTAGHA